MVEVSTAIAFLKYALMFLLFLFKSNPLRLTVTEILVRTGEVVWQSIQKINISVCAFQVTREYTVKQVSIPYFLLENLYFSLFSRGTVMSSCYFKIFVLVNLCESLNQLLVVSNVIPPHSFQTRQTNRKSFQK